MFDFKKRGDMQNITESETPSTVEDEFSPDELSGFAGWANAKSDEAWRLIQYIAGGVLGLGAAAALFLLKDEGGGFISMNLLIALLCALVLPKVIQKQAKRSFAKGQIALVISMGACIIGYLIYCLATGRL